uniref:Uncharacterized protein n=1 Tax=Rhizophora mucronata TaxID=61149 RepID=A0A2P2IQN5_RHIMU
MGCHCSHKQTIPSLYYIQ